jgi:hypothetical protein
LTTLCPEVHGGPHIDGIGRHMQGDPTQLTQPTSTTSCPSCRVTLPFPPGDLITCPRCAPRVDVASRIAAELVEAALSATEGSVTSQLLSAADAWRSVLPSMH